MRFKHLRRQTKSDYGTGRFLSYQRAKVKAGRVCENDLREVEAMPDNWPPLLDAAGNEIPTDACRCGRPKLRRKLNCCFDCARLAGFHSPICTMRCINLGIQTGYAITATPRRYAPGEALVLA